MKKLIGSSLVVVLCVVALVPDASARLNSDIMLYGLEFTMALKGWLNPAETTQLDAIQQTSLLAIQDTREVVWRLADRGATVVAPMAVDGAGFSDLGKKLRALKPITSTKAAVDAIPVLMGLGIPIKMKDDKACESAFKDPAKVKECDFVLSLAGLEELQVGMASFKMFTAPDAETAKEVQQVDHEYFESLRRLNALAYQVGDSPFKKRSQAMLAVYSVWQAVSAAALATNPAAVDQGSLRDRRGAKLIAASVALAMGLAVEAGADRASVVKEAFRFLRGE